MADVRNYSGDRSAFGRFETFLFSAITTVVLVRAFLIATGYPKVGGHGLHIAHVLWGGLLMGAAITMTMVLPGSRSRRRAAVVGGIGFGLFIDEVGKFLTSSVNYFFQPAIAIIYVVFVLFYLVVRDVVMRRPLNRRQRLAIAATAVADLTLGQLTSAGRDYALGMLSDDGRDALDGHIRAALLSENVSAPGAETRITRAREWAHEKVVGALEHERAHVGLYAVIVIQLVLLLGQLALLLVHPDLGASKGSTVTLRLAEISAVASGIYAAFGLVRALRGHRAGALRVLYRSVLVTTLVTQTMVFAEYQAAGVVGLVVDLALLGLLRLAGEAAPSTFVSTTAAAAPGPRRDSGSPADPTRPSPAASAP